MPRHPEAYINFEVYEDSNNFLGISKITLPDITYIAQNISGAGIAGTVEAIMAGIVNAMTAKLEFRSPTGAAISLLKPGRHNIDVRVAEQQQDTVSGAKTIAANKYVLGVEPKGLTMGSVAPAAAADASGEYSVKYYAAYQNGRKLFEVDPLNYIFIVDGVDYLQDVRAALGR